MLTTMKKLVRENDVCVLATAFQGEPHCSLMSYAADDDGREIFMITDRQSKKYRNLKSNHAVSLLIDTREKHSAQDRVKVKALTVSGVYQGIDDEAKKKHILARLLERHPHLREFAQNPDADVVCIRVKSFQLLDGITDAYFESLD